MHFMLNDCAAGLVISEEGLAAMLPHTDTPVLFVDRDAAQIARQPSTPINDAADLDAIAYVMYTSGSTGQPKGVQVTHRGLVNFLWSMRRVPGLGEGDVLLAVTTISFDIAGLELYLPWIVGGRVLLARRDVTADGRRLLELLVQRQPAVMQATPATWRALLDAGWAVGDTPGLRAFCGGEALPRDLAEAMLVRTSEVWNLYGPTETTIWSLVHRVTSGTGAVPIGRPIANTQAYVLDTDGRPAPLGVPGELYIGGIGVARGYLGRPELTGSRFLPDPFAGGASRMYRTGDRVRLRQDGTFEHLGRLDFQVKLRGYRIELGEIEAALAASPAIAQCVVDVRDDRLIAWLVFAEQEELTASEVRAFLRESLPDYMVPSLVMPLDRLPLTPNGKVDRKALPDPLRATRQPQVRTAPSTAAEVIVAEVWCELLRLDQVGTGDNFFELGGHSLLSMRAVHEIQQRAGWRPDPRLLFFQSLGQIAAAMPEPPPRL
jgi:amino acid adenylation domain-containing protein